MIKLPNLLEMKEEHKSDFCEFLVLDEIRNCSEIEIETLTVGLVEKIKEINKLFPTFDFSKWSHSKTVIEVLDELIIYGILQGPDINPSGEYEDLDGLVTTTKLTDGYYYYLKEKLGLK